MRGVYFAIVIKTKMKQIFACFFLLGLCTQRTSINAGKTLLMLNNGKVIDSLKNFKPNKIWIKAHATHEDFTATFSYSIDGEKFLLFGNRLTMGLGLDWTANRFALLNYSTKKEGEGGYADYNWFHFKGENN